MELCENSSFKRDKCVGVERMSESGVPCPACGNILLTSVIEKDIPHFGPVLIIVDRCERCGYKETTIHVIGESAGTHHELLVDSVEKLNYYVVRGPSATLTIPELGMEIQPIKGRGEAFITTVEGVFQRFREKLEFLKIGENDLEKVEKIRELLHIIDLVLEGKYSVHLVLDDPSGKSTFYLEEQ